MMKINLCGIELKNPVIAASGTFNYGMEVSKFYDLRKLGAIVSSGLTFKEKRGNKGQRLYETPSGLMNSIGLQNESIEVFIEKDLQKMMGLGTESIINLGGNSLEDYIEGAKLLDKTNIKIIELNISCPNIEVGGKAFGMECALAEEVVREVKKITDKVLMVKLTPNAPSIVDVAKACEEAGADAISLVNTFNGLAIDIKNRKPIFNNITAGLSGPAIKPIALNMVRSVSKAVDIPIVGMGGIMDSIDAIEFIMAGSLAVQVGTANFVDPLVMPKIIQGIEDFMAEEGIKDLEEIRGII